MRKKLIVFGILATVCAVCVSMFVFSDGGININLILEHTSELRQNYFRCDMSYGFAELYSGLREEPFEYDGKSCPKMEFAIVRVVFFDQSIDLKFIDVSLSLNGEISKCKLEQNPYDNSYMVDLEKIVNDNTVFILSFEDSRFSDAELNCISKNWAIDYSKALEVGSNELKSFIKKQNNSLNAEFYLRTVQNSSGLSESYFWTFSIKTLDNKSASVVIDVNTGKILAKH